MRFFSRGLRIDTVKLWVFSQKQSMLAYIGLTCDASTFMTVENFGDIVIRNFVSCWLSFPGVFMSFASLCFIFSFSHLSTWRRCLTIIFRLQDLVLVIQSKAFIEWLLVWWFSSDWPIRWYEIGDADCVAYAWWCPWDCRAKSEASRQSYSWVLWFQRPELTRLLILFSSLLHYGLMSWDNHCRCLDELFFG